MLGNTSDGPDGKVFIYGDANRLSTGIDTDGDGVFDHQDRDSDNDGIPDLLENGATSIQVLTDTNGDGIVDDFDGDLQGTGFQPVTASGEVVNTANFPDADGNGLIDVLEPNIADPELGSAIVRTGLSGSACSIGASSGGVSDPLLPLLGLLAAGGVMIRRRKAVLIKR